MKKSIVIGGSNGIGLSLVKSLQERGSFVFILDMVEPPIGILDESKFEYKKIDLFNLDLSILDIYRSDLEIDTLIITVGIGRVEHFSKLSIMEIEKVMTVNATSILKIIRFFWDRISHETPFYTGIIASIAGLVSSPLFSVYAASKSALNRFIESVNIELEASHKVRNRILNISPGAIDGTKFNGGDNNLLLTQKLSEQIISNLFRNEMLFIPNYEEIYSKVINSYINDPHQFGLNSYKYKIDNNRLSNKSLIKIGYLSGTFDLFHVGHLNLLKKAKENCDYLIVGVHPNASHKGKETFVSYEERKSIIESCKYVDRVVQSCPEDSDAWELYHYDKLFVGSDYVGSERFKRYETYFLDKNVEIVYFPYTQGTSSSQLRELIYKEIKRE